MLDGGFYDFFQFCELGIGRVYCMATSRLLSESDRVNRGDEIPEGSRLRLRTHWSRRACLPCGESVVLVIEHYIRDIEISATRMDEVPHTDTIAITITSDGDHSEIRICHLHSGGEWQSATMKGLSCISVDILARLPRASDS
jgi:hypothetical protein